MREDHLHNNRDVKARRAINYIIALVIAVREYQGIIRLRNNALQPSESNGDIDGKEHYDEAWKRAKRMTYQACWIDPQKGNS